MTRDTTFPDGDWRKGYFNPKNLNATLDRVDRLREDVPAGMTLPELAIRFILSNPVVSTIIVGMRKEQHVRGNLALSDAGGLDAGADPEDAQTSLGAQPGPVVGLKQEAQPLPQRFSSRLS